MIKKVESLKDLKKFIHFKEKLYKDDPHHVNPIFFFLTKELKREVLVNKEYTAILAYRNNEIVGRLLFAYDHSKKRNEEICYFSYFDVINDFNVVKELFDYMENHMKQKGIRYFEGTFTPYDPDTRRGILIKGFDSDPVIFTSYNFEYYGKLLDEYGCYKAIDTVLLDAKHSEKSKKKLNTLTKFFLRNHDVRIDSLEWKHLDRDLLDVHEIIKQATNELIYQDAPGFEMIEGAARQLKPFINPKFIKIARENKTNKPIGFCLVTPDFNQVLKKTKGRLRPLRMLYLKRKITKARGQMQYVIPEYQASGLIGYMFKELYDEFTVFGIKEFEAGTMMEDNPRPINIFKKFGGDIIKIYRIYGKDVK